MTLCDGTTGSGSEPVCLSFRCSCVWWVAFGSAARGTTGRCARLGLGAGPLDVTGWTKEELSEGTALITEIGRFGPGGRALYDPRPGDPARWDWDGDSP